MKKRLPKAKGKKIYTKETKITKTDEKKKKKKTLTTKHPWEKYRAHDKKH